jgi:hypothetical protein
MPRRTPHHCRRSTVLTIAVAVFCRWSILTPASEEELRLAKRPSILLRYERPRMLCRQRCCADRTINWAPP